MTLARQTDRYRELLARYLAPQRGRVAWLGVLLLTGIALQLANPQVIRYFLDTTQSGSSQAGLLLAGAAFIAFALLRQLLNLATYYTGAQVAWTATNRLRRDMTLHTLRLDMDFHKAHTPGELIDRVDGDATALSNFMSEFVLHVLGNSLLVVGILALLFAEDVRVGLGLTLYCLATVAILTLVQQAALKRWVAARQASAELYGFLEERISGAEDIRAAGAGPYMLYRLFQILRAWLRHYRGAWIAGSFINNFTNLLSVAGYALGLGLGVYLYTHGQASIGTAYLIVAYTAMLAMPLQGIRNQARDFQQSGASVQRVYALLALSPRVKDPAAGQAEVLPAGALAVAFEDVSFRYDDDADVLSNVSFAVAPGRVLGVLGRTGSGKSTLTRLLIRLYDPTRGAIRLNGTDLRALPLAALRARIGMVTQDVQLFQSSLRDNLAFFNGGVADEQIRQALWDLRLWDWVQSLPHGLDTLLAAGGAGLSAGEAQLLTFARVFLKNPGVVVLDEASSRLDPATESLLERAVDGLLFGRTGVIIAHRLRTVQRADDILILEAGRVIEYGARLTLAANRSSCFYGLLQTGLEAALA